MEEIKETLIEETEEKEQTEIESEEEEKTLEDETKESEDESKQSEPKKQSSEQNKKYAEKRRAKEAKEREEAIKRAKQEGIIEGLGGTNPYTGEKIEDDIDFELYKEMRDAESKGYDPNNVKEMLKYRKQTALEQQQKENEKRKAEERIQKNIEDFITAHSDVDVEKLFKDENFKKFSEGLLESVPLNLVYEKYKEFEDASHKKAEDIATEEKSRRISSVKTLGSPETVEKITLEQIRKMSREEISKNYDKVMESYFKN